MGKQTTETGKIQIRYENYLFLLRVISEKEIGLEITDAKTYKIFVIESYSFSQSISSYTLIAALKKQKESQIKISISQEQNSEKDIQLKVILRVSYDFIPSFEEIIILPIKKGGDCESDIIRTQLQIINQDIRVLQNSLDENTQIERTKYVSYVKSGDYCLNDTIQISICKLSIPKGKYEINLAFFSKYKLLSQQLFYGYLRNDLTQQHILNSEGLYYQISNQTNFTPHILRTILEVKDDKQTLSFISINTQTCPWYLKNLILSATSI